jgi:hypothetical protein
LTPASVLAPLLTVTVYQFSCFPPHNPAEYFENAAFLKKNEPMAHQLFLLYLAGWLASLCLSAVHLSTDHETQESNDYRNTAYFVNWYTFDNLAHEEDSK